jgi:hypothetical protein
VIDEFGEANPAGAAEAPGGDDRGDSMVGLDWIGVREIAGSSPPTQSPECLRRFGAPHRSA